MSKKYISGEIREFDKAQVLETRTVQFIISSDTKDAHRSIVNMDGWNLSRFAKNGIVGYQHNVYGGNMCTPDDPDDVIGSGRAWIEEVDGRKLLIGEVRFEPADINPKAEKIFRKVLNGTLRATSVGFIEIGKGEWKKANGEPGDRMDKESTYYFKGQELLEFSVVNIPSNPDAVGRSISVQKDWAIAFIMRFMSEDVSIKDLRDMKVGDVLDLVEGKVRDKIEQDQPTDKKAKFSKRLKYQKTF